MIKETFAVDNFVHIYNRGSRRQAIVRADRDWWHFLQILYYFNSEYMPPTPFETLRRLLGREIDRSLVWPKEWPERKPLVEIVCYVLMENHFHLLIKEIQEGGTAKFMARLGDGMTKYYNTKYDEVGSIWQGTYNAKTILDDRYLRDVSVYIQVKNVFERYPGGGLKIAIKEFDRAWEWAVNDPYSSLGVYAGKKSHPAQMIVRTDILGEIFESPQEYKKYARDGMLAKDSIELDKKLEFLIFPDL